MSKSEFDIFMVEPFNKIIQIMIFKTFYMVYNTEIDNNIFACIISAKQNV